MNIETTIIKMPGLSRKYTFFHTSDCHLAHAEPWEGEEAAAKAQAKVEAWSYAGILPKDAFEQALKTVDDAHADGLFLCGDVVDYLSDGTMGAVRERLQKLSTELFYVCGNHERSGAPEGRGFYPAYQEWMRGDPAFWVRDFGEFMIVGMDDGDKKMQKEQLDKLEALCKQEKPILLLIHIPLLTEAIMPPVRQKWGENGPDYFLLGQETDTELSRRFCQMLADPAAPIKAVFAGHIHLSHTGEIIPGRMQYVSAPTFEGGIRQYILEAE